MCNFLKLKKTIFPNIDKLPSHAASATLSYISTIFPSQKRRFWIDVQWFFRSAGTSANSEIQLVAPGRSGRKRGFYLFFFARKYRVWRAVDFFFLRTRVPIRSSNRKPGCLGSGSHFVLNWRGVKNDEKRISGYPPKIITVNDFPRCALVHNWIHFWKSPNFWQKRQNRFTTRKKARYFLTRVFGPKSGFLLSGTREPGFEYPDPFDPMY